MKHSYKKILNIYKMKKAVFIISLVLGSFVANSQVNHVDGETKLINPTGRTLMIEKNDNDSWLTFHDPDHLRWIYGNISGSVCRGSFKYKERVSYN